MDRAEWGVIGVRLTCDDDNDDDLCLAEGWFGARYRVVARA